ncbi:MAG: ThuA domain-containing protein [Halorhabdus sp.]
MTAHATIWNENVHEQHNPSVAERYPDGIHGAVADALRSGDDITVKTATLQDPENGLTEETLAWTDVLLWWSHTADDEVERAIVDRVVEAVRDGMGFIALHSGKDSVPFRRLLGTTTEMKYRHGGERERIWVVDPGHPITDGLEESFEVPETEMYGEPHDIPEPDRTVFVSWFEGGEVFRSGVCYRRGRGRIFAFRPGHEAYPIYHQSEVRQVIRNAVQWAAPTEGATVTYGETESPGPLEQA